MAPLCSASVRWASVSSFIRPISLPSTIEAANALEGAKEVPLEQVGEMLDFRPRQFAFVEIEGKGWNEPLLFMISSALGEARINPVLFHDPGDRARGPAPDPSPSRRRGRSGRRPFSTSCATERPSLALLPWSRSSPKRRILPGVDKMAENLPDPPPSYDYSCAGRSRWWTAAGRTSVPRVLPAASSIPERLSCGERGARA